MPAPRSSSAVVIPEGVVPPDALRETIMARITWRALDADRKDHVDALMELFAGAAWTSHRVRRDVVRMLRHTPFTLAGVMKSPRSAGGGMRLAAFCRVLTDFTFRAVLYDVIVPADLQGLGLGREVVTRAMGHRRLAGVERWYLKTEDKHPFYEKFGWTRDAEHFMELIRPKRGGGR